MIKLSKMEGQDKIINRARQIVRESYSHYHHHQYPPNRAFTYIEALEIAEEEYKDGSE